MPDCESQLTEHESLAVDIDTLLTKLRGVNDDMSASCQGGGGGGSRSQQHLVQVRSRKRVSPCVQVYLLPPPSSLLSLPSLPLYLTSSLPHFLSSARPPVCTPQRYREILHDYSTEYRKTKGSIERKRESAVLFRQVNGDGGGANGGRSDTDQLLRERGSLNNAHREADDVLQVREKERERERERECVCVGILRLVSHLQHGNLHTADIDD